jgi:acetyltransferase
MGSIREMLDPRSIALIGATDREGSIGRAVLTNLLGSTGRPLYLVNPYRQKALNLPCLPHIGDAPALVSLAVIVTPAATVPRLVEECGEAGVAGTIILSAGFGESGPEGRRLEEEVIGIRNNYGMRIMGPHCLGVILPHVGLNTTFLDVALEPGNVALISQSGALGNAILDWGTSTGIGFRMFASLGSMIDIGFGDLIDFLNDDYETRSIMMYMENMHDARRFISAARSFALRKPIVVLKPGRYAESARAIRSHTGGRMGDDRVYDAVFKRVGLIRVKEVVDLFNVAPVLDSRRLPKGERLAIVTNAGGAGIIATDTLAELGGVLAGFSAASVEKLNSFLPEQSSRDNPIDIAGDADMQLYVSSVEACVGDKGVDGVLVIYTPRATADAIDLARSLIEVSRKTGKPIIAVWMGGSRAAEGRRILLEANLPAYETPEEAVKTYLYMYRYRRNIELLYETPAEVGQAGRGLHNDPKEIVGNAIKEKRHFLGTEDVLDLLMNYRVQTVRTAVVTSVSRIEAEVRRMGLPLLLTWNNLDDGDTYQTSLATDEDVTRARAEVEQRSPGNTEIVLQKPAEPDSYSFGLRSRRDPDFLTVILLGGQKEGTEAGTVSIGLPPLNQILARRLLDEAGVYRALSGTAQGQGVLVRLEESLVGFSNLIVDLPEIAAIDINPLVVGHSETYTLNASMLIDRDYVERGFRYPHLVIMPYPNSYVASWKLQDGPEVVLRPIRPEDESLMHELATSASREAIRTRFFSPIDMSHDWLIFLCNVDYDRHMAIVAETTEEGKRKIIGVARLVMKPDFRSGEFAIFVHDRYQRKGLAHKLMEIIIGIGREKGLEEIVGDVLAENDKMLKLARKMGFKVRPASYGVNSIFLKLKNTANQHPDNKKRGEA